MKTTFPKNPQEIQYFYSPISVLFGIGAISQLGVEAKRLGATKALIVTDKGVVESGLAQDAIEALEAEGIRFMVFDEVEPEPPIRVVDECTKRLKSDQFDIVVGLGGGSVIDTAKAAAVLITNDRPISAYFGIDLIEKRGLPKIFIPTTAGTGSEVSRVSIVTDEKAMVKNALFSNFLLADVAIVDPLLTLSMPLTLTADSGIDALVHAIEAYVSKKATRFSDLLALEAIRLIGRSISKAYAKGQDIEARSNMAFASLIAGMAFSSGGLGAVHALAYPLGTEFHLPHGRSNAIMLPHVMEFNLIGNAEKFSDIAKALGEKTEHLSIRESAIRAAEIVKQILNELSVPFKLKEYDIKQEAIPTLVEGAMKQTRLFAVNPRDLREEDLQEIYQRAW